MLRTLGTTLCLSLISLSAAGQDMGRCPERMSTERRVSLATANEKCACLLAYMKNQITDEDRAVFRPGAASSADEQARLIVKIALLESAAFAHCGIPAPGGR